MKRVLLTGAAGFVGQHCLHPLLAQGYQVHATTSLKHAPPAALAGVHWYSADLLDAGHISALLTEVRPTHLLHCAWYAVPGKYWTAAENFRWVEAGMHLLQAFAAHGGQRVVGVGSCAEYDWGNGHCSELVTPLEPATTYGTCKHALQLSFTAFCKQARISAAWGRLFFLYGPYEPSGRLVAAAIRSILREEPFLCSHGQQIRDFSYVQDAAHALVSLLDSEVLGPVNIASGAPVALHEVIQEIADQLQRPDLVRLGALPPSENEPPVLVADVARLRNEVGWSPRYDLSSGLAETIAWWKLQQEGTRK
jgi:nucleoside-diphosphate-sugar epimerase